MRLIAYGLLLSFFLSGCTATHYLKKAERALIKAEQKGAKIKRDTVFVTKTITVPEYRTDTLIKQVDFHDTIKVENERIKWKVKVDTKYKTVYVDATCKADTIRIKVPVEIVKEIKAGYNVGTIIRWVILALVVGAILSKVFIK